MIVYQLLWRTDEDLAGQSKAAQLCRSIQTSAPAYAGAGTWSQRNDSPILIGKDQNNRRTPAANGIGPIECPLAREIAHMAKNTSPAA